jgi:hypothetical protein
MAGGSWSFPHMCESWRRKVFVPRRRPSGPCAITVSNHFHGNWKDLLLPSLSLGALWLTLLLGISLTSSSLKLQGPVPSPLPLTANWKPEGWLWQADGDTLAELAVKRFCRAEFVSSEGRRTSVFNVGVLRPGWGWFSCVWHPHLHSPCVVEKGSSCEPWHLTGSRGRLLPLGQLRISYLKLCL